MWHPGLPGAALPPKGCRMDDGTRPAAGGPCTEDSRNKGWALHYSPQPHIIYSAALLRLFFTKLMITGKVVTNTMPSTMTSRCSLRSKP